MTKFVERTEENLMVSIDVTAALFLHDHVKPETAVKLDQLADKLMSLLGGPCDYDADELALAICKKYGIE